MEMAEEAELANYRWWDEPEKVQWKKFNPMNNTIVTPTDNKRYIRIDEYEALLTEEDNTKSIKYEERLIDYDKNYESYDYRCWTKPLNNSWNYIKIIIIDTTKRRKPKLLKLY